MGPGAPFNIASYAFLTVMISLVVNLRPGDFVHALDDAHVYNNHVNALKIQCKRNPQPFPKIHIKQKIKSIEDFTIDDFEMVNYNPHPKIIMEMSV
jgi:thymidylate synthase